MRRPALELFQRAVDGPEVPLPILAVVGLDQQVVVARVEVHRRPAVEAETERGAPPGTTGQRATEIDGTFGARIGVPYLIHAFEPDPAVLGRWLEPAGPSQGPRRPGRWPSRERFSGGRFEDGSPRQDVRGAAVCRDQVPRGFRRAPMRSMVRLSNGVDTKADANRPVWNMSGTSDPVLTFGSLTSRAPRRGDLALMPPTPVTSLPGGPESISGTPGQNFRALGLISGASEQNSGASEKDFRTSR